MGDQMYQMALDFTHIFAAADYLIEKKKKEKERKKCLKIKQQQDLLRTGFRFCDILSAKSNYKSEPLKKYFNSRGIFSIKQK